MTANLNFTNVAVGAPPYTSDRITNGSFGSDTSWTKGTGWTIASGVASHAAGSASELSQAVALAAGYRYRVTFIVSGFTAGTVTPTFTGGVTTTGTARSANGSYTEELTAVSGNVTFALLASSDFVGSIDSLSVYSVRYLATMRLTSSTAIAAIDTIYFYPYLCPVTTTFINGRIYVVTGGAGSSLKAGIWANSTVSNRPLGAPLYKDDTGVASTSSSTDAVIALGSGTLTIGVLYWIGVKTTGTPPTVYGNPTTSQLLNTLAGGTASWHSSLAYADTYSNAMPTIAESAVFTLGSSVCPHLTLIAT